MSELFKGLGSLFAKKESEKKAPDAKGMSRRTFLKASGAVGLAAGIAAATEATRPLAALGAALESPVAQYEQPRETELHAEFRQVRDKMRESSAEVIAELPDTWEAHSFEDFTNVFEQLQQAWGEKLGSPRNSKGEQWWPPTVKQGTTTLEEGHHNECDRLFLQLAAEEYNLLANANVLNPETGSSYDTHINKKVLESLFVEKADLVLAAGLVLQTSMDAQKDIEGKIATGQSDGSFPENKQDWDWRLVAKGKRYEGDQKTSFYTYRADDPEAARAFRNIADEDNPDEFERSLMPLRALTGYFARGEAFANSEALEGLVADPIAHGLTYYENFGSYLGQVMETMQEWPTDARIAYDPRKGEFRYTSEGKEKNPVDARIGDLHTNHFDELYWLEVVLQGEVRTAEDINRKLVQNVVDFSRDQYLYPEGELDSSAEIDIFLDNLRNNLDPDENREQVGEALPHRDEVKRALDFYLNTFPSYDNMTKIHLMFKEPGYSERPEKVFTLMEDMVKITALVEGTVSKIDKDIDGRGAWPKNGEEIDWGKVDWRKVSTENGQLHYRDTAITDFRVRRELGVMPARAILLKIIYDPDSGRKYDSLSVEGKDSFDRMINLMTWQFSPDSRLVDQYRGGFNSHLVDGHFGQIHNDFSTGEAKPSYDYEQLVKLEEELYSMQ